MAHPTGMLAPPAGYHIPVVVILDLRYFYWHYR